MSGGKRACTLLYLFQTQSTLKHDTSWADFREFAETVGRERPESFWHPPPTESSHQERPISAMRSFGWVGRTKSGARSTHMGSLRVGRAGQSLRHFGRAGHFFMLLMAKANAPNQNRGFRCLRGILSPKPRPEPLCHMVNGCEMAYWRFPPMTIRGEIMIQQWVKITAGKSMKNFSNGLSYWASLTFGTVTATLAGGRRFWINTNPLISSGNCCNFYLFF